MTHRTFSRIVVLTMCLLGLGLAHAVAQQEQIDWNKARQLHGRMLKGEKLTDEERAYHDRAAQALRAKAGAERRPPPPAKPPVGLKPLSDMTAGDRYKNEDSGLGAAFLL